MIWFLISIIVASAVFLYRNDLVYRVRMALIAWNLDLYETLPGYDTTLVHPRYWRYWTKDKFVQALQQEAKNNA